MIGCWLYVRHARTAPAPLLDLNLLKVDTFFASVVGGFLYRIGVGATPFLLPLFLQLGFGLTPLQSGMLTFASAVGAIAMKATAAPIIRQFGFKRVLVSNAVISSCFIAAVALFTVGTPHIVVLAVLLVGGFFKSLEFTSINSIAYADIDAKAMSRATSFASVAQQLSLSAGVAVGALVLEFERMGRADTDRRGRRLPARLHARGRDRGKLGVHLRHAAERGRREPVGPLASSCRPARAGLGPAGLAQASRYRA